MRKRITVGRIGRVALAILVAALSLGQLVARYPAVFRQMKRALGSVDDRLLRAALRRLETAGALTLSASGDVTLTQDGLRLALSRALGVEKVPPPLTWDGAWGVVAFDVPGDFSAERTMLRECLLAIGFVRAQKSVYVHPSAAALAAFAKIASLMGAERRLLVLTSAEIDGDETLRRKFAI